MRILAFKLIVSLSICSFSIVKAQDIPSAPVSNRFGGSEVSSSTLDLNTTKLPAGYQCVNRNELFKALALIADSYAKNEYETKAQHQARIQQLPSNPIIDGRFPISIFDVQLNPKSLKSSYDADRRILTVRVPPTDVKDAKFEINKALNSGPEITQTSERYNAQNGFGATVQVYKLKAIHFILLHE